MAKKNNNARVKGAVKEQPKLKIPEIVKIYEKELQELEQTTFGDAKKIALRKEYLRGFLEGFKAANG